jgi:hypothetical protein
MKIVFSLLTFLSLLGSFHSELGLAADPVRPMPAEFKISTTIAAFPFISKYSLDGSADETTFKVKIRETAPFPKRAATSNLMADFLRTFGYTENEVDRIDTLEIEFPLSACKLHKDSPLAFQCATKSPGSIQFKGANGKWINMAAHELKLFEHNLATRAVTGFSVESHKGPEKLRFDYRLSAVGRTVEGRQAFQELEIEDSKIAEIKAEISR